MSWPAFFYPHRVRVRDSLGSGGMGTTWTDAPGRELAAEVKDEVKLVRTDGGAEVVSSTQVSVPLSADVAVDALVTVWPGTPSARESRVIRASRNDNTGTPLDSFLLLYLE